MWQASSQRNVEEGVFFLLIFFFRLAKREKKKKGKKETSMKMDDGPWRAERERWGEKAPL